MVRTYIPTVEYKDVLEKNGGWYVRLFPKVEGEMTSAYESFTLTEPTEEVIDAIRVKCVEDARRDKIIKINTHDVSSAVNGFILNGMQTWLTKDTRVGLVRAAEAKIADGEESMPLWLGTIQLTVNCQQAITMLNALERYALDCFNVTAQHLAEVKAMTDIDAIEQFDETVGYPEQLNFTIE